MFSIPYLPQILVVALAILVVYLAIQLGRKLVEVLLNSLFGVVALFIINTLPFAAIKIDAWSLLIAAVGGIFGIIALLLLSHFGITF